MDFYLYFSANEPLLSLRLEVEPQYSGARIEGEVVKLEFVKNMIEDFRNQKSLHKRFVAIYLFLPGGVFSIVHLQICPPNCLANPQVASGPAFSG